ncbi:MAG: hypothetical protein KGJ41_15535, partial [Rhodospirillales bacterium]|nr:hypothetical protein [Rhodospirillales bacterium]
IVTIVLAMSCPTLKIETQWTDTMAQAFVAKDAVGMHEAVAAAVRQGCRSVLAGSRGRKIDSSGVFVGYDRIRWDNDSSAGWVQREVVAKDTTENKNKSSEVADWYYKNENDNSSECKKLSETPKDFADKASKIGATSFDFTENDSLHADEVISYKIGEKVYSYSFYKTHALCSNPFNAQDNTKKDLSRILPYGNNSQDQQQRILDGAALTHASDEGAWWVFDGTKMNPACALSKITPMQDAQDARKNGARDVQIEGNMDESDGRARLEIIVEYDLNGKNFFNSYSKSKGCNWKK